MDSINKKAAFNSWVSKHKLKITNANEFSETLEKAFLLYYDMDVWAINDSKVYSDLRTSLLSKKSFKKNDKKSFKLIKCYGKTYKNFLLYYDDKTENNYDYTNKAQSIADNKLFKLNNEKLIDIKFIDENKKINEFFNNENLSNQFYYIFEYDKSVIPDLVLDIRKTIIGAKLNGQRLRFYSDKSGLLKIKVNNSNFVSLSLLSSTFEYARLLIDESNTYFSSHIDEVTIDKETDSTKKNINVVENKMSYPIDYTSVIEQVFPDGFPFSNPLKKRRFISSYGEINGREFSDNEVTFESKIHTCGFIFEKKVYLASMVNDDLKNQIQKYIDDAFLNSTTPLYYSILFEVFKDNLNPIFGSDMFASYLRFAFKDIYKFENDCICKKGTHVDLVQELINVFINCGRPLNIEEIYSELPTISHSAIDKTLEDKNFLVNYRGKCYFYKGIIAIDDCDYHKICQFIKNCILINGSLTGEELFNFIRKELPDLVENNPGVTELGFKNIMKLKFGQNFCFNGDIISALDNDVDIKSLYTDFAKQREKFTFKELEEYRDSIHQNRIDYESILSISIRLNQNEFIRGDLIDFDVQSIDDAISKCCNNGYISFCNIINYTDFPSILYIWNSYVLESYVYCRSKRFKLLHQGFNKEKPVGVILNTDSAYETFDDVLIDVIRRSKRCKKDDIYSYLIENDYLLTKKYKNIDFLVNEARK